jgi:hypothetical protein
MAATGRNHFNFPTPLIPFKIGSQSPEAITANSKVNHYSKAKFTFYLRKIHILNNYVWNREVFTDDLKKKKQRPKPRS